MRVFVAIWSRMTVTDRMPHAERYSEPNGDVRRPG
jgi:hypothetical protein